MRKKLPSSYLLRNRSEFGKVYRGNRYENRSFIVYSNRNNAGHWRVGVVINRKYGPAVQRNAVRRRIKEYFRVCMGRERSMDFIVIPKRNTEMERNLLREVCNRVRR